MSHTTTQNAASLPLSDSKPLPRRIAFGIAASAFVAVCAHIAVPMPFTAVPLTLQPFAVLLVGLLLGPLDGFLALSLYLVEGASGLPVFTPTGPGGLLQLVGPSGGFLFSYPLVAAITGGLFRGLRLRNRFAAATIAGTAATAVLYAAGATWFAALLHASMHTVWIGAIAPFLPGEVVKILAAAGIATALTQKRS